ncbi:universal stress protein [Yinghuangia seranimata]|uniref:universal stress protein n=1 Tax=Yinghuangia seranimata TaxID=408067 RepID=UPI00248AA1BB|nr:universal stress protein [Yinghuangia seranimata]MDI2129523.1 universal stress protein [Yinghuangia seranimata]
MVVPLGRRRPGGPRRPRPLAGSRTRARTQLADVVSAARHVEPDVRIDQDVVRDSAARALVEASEKAELLVLATRQRPHSPGMHIGTTTHAVLHRTRCPLLVIPVAPNGTNARAEGP